MGWMAPWHRSAKMVVVKDHQQREPGPSTHEAASFISGSREIDGRKIH
jgi:hypothetical protein